MSSKKHLDPRAQAAVEHLRAYATDWCGAIRPKLLTAALPPRGPKRGWRDFVAHAVLEEIISAHREMRGGGVFFNGPLYRVVHRDLARQLCTSPDEISSALTWLEALGVIGRVPRTLLNDEGQPCGKQVFAYPIMPALQELLDRYQTTGKTPGPFVVTPKRAGLTPAKRQVDSLEDPGSPPRRRGDSLNCAQAQQKHAESVGLLSAQRLERVAKDDRRRRVGTGGGAAADNKAQVPHMPPATPPRSADATRSTPQRQPAPMPPAPAHDPSKEGSNGPLSPPASPLWTPPPPPMSLKVDNEAKRTAWMRATKFCALWAQAITRLNFLSTCTPTTPDYQAAFKFFLNHPETGSFFPVAIAIDAWFLTREPEPTGYDDLYHVRTSLEIRRFFQSLASGKLESEVGRRFTINAWDDLRLCFTESELIHYGWPVSRVPIKGLKPDQLWENDPDALKYYRDRNLPLPLEVAEADNRRCVLDQKNQEKK